MEEKPKRMPGNSRGPLPGTHHAGTFKKNDPRINKEGPFVRKKMSFNQMINRHTEKAVETLVSVLDNEEASNQDKFKCAELILAHAQGSPVNRSVQAQIGTSTDGDVSALSLEQLKAKATALLESQLDSQAIDADFEEVPPGDS